MQGMGAGGYGWLPLVASVVVLAAAALVVVALAVVDVALAALVVAGAPAAVVVAGDGAGVLVVVGTILVVVVVVRSRTAATLHCEAAVEFSACVVHPSEHARQDVDPAAAEYVPRGQPRQYGVSTANFPAGHRVHVAVSWDETRAAKMRSSRIPPLFCIFLY